MGDALNIENLLTTGYFTTSRARSTDPSVASSSHHNLMPAAASDVFSDECPGPPVPRNARPASNPPPVPAHGHIPRTVHLAPAPPSKTSFPPPVTVEEETVSLAREHGSPRPSVDSEADPPSRGEVDQNPIIMEVHQHNPERRFVIVPDDTRDQAPLMEKTASADRPPRTEKAKAHGHGDQHSTSRQAPESKGAKDANDSDLSPSEFETRRSRSRHELPHIDTDLGRDHAHHHDQTRSAAPRPSPDHYHSRQSRPHGDQFLSPDKISTGPGPKTREKTYPGRTQSSAPQGARSPSRPSHHFEDRDRNRDRTSSARQYTADFETDRRRYRGARDADVRSRDNYTQPRSDKRPEGPRPRLSPRSSRDAGRLANDYIRSSRESGHSSSKPVVIQDARSSARLDRREESSGPGLPRSTPRTSTLPSASVPTGVLAGAMAYEAAQAASIDTARLAPRPAEQTGRAPRTALPYPDDDLPPHVSYDVRDASSEARQPNVGETSGTFTMPESPPIYPPGRSSLHHSANGIPERPAAANTSQAWTSGPSGPDRDGLPSERPIGTYRRYSENNGKNEADALPECPRQRPVAGLVDWLTLPHTSLNICPSCYDGTFAKSEYRSLFQPMLRPLHEPISCDFGVCPWHRIAWLLTLKDKMPDLRLLQQIASVSAASSREPCPGSKTATRSWLTVKDPRTRLPVDCFSVCYQCAKIVELLLPNLIGVFEPLDSRPRTDVCALHFAPDRKQFVLLFDALETTSDEAMSAKKPPDVEDLAQKLWHRTVGAKCRQDTPVIDGYWHTMQYLREFTVCRNCFDDAVRPQLGDGNALARNFYTKPQRLPSATCQLYSPRMREVFRRSCRVKDPDYLEEKVIQRRRKEKEIYDELVKVDYANASDAWKKAQVGKLVDEWKRWE
ncbi:hypothetical protein E4U42_006343 [Claviceps africana]|uniref:Ser/arg-related nuclear matrix protein n=1 Tax=Claviceps africana TaxID=83212 RepID=A0A8K0J8H5_9HYPO|nr:hypothetical protein E4U42_006343 [Claviceps africana]